MAPEPKILKNMPVVPVPLKFLTVVAALNTRNNEKKP